MGQGQGQAKRKPNFARETTLSTGERISHFFVEKLKGSLILQIRKGPLFEFTKEFNAVLVCIE